MGWRYIICAPYKGHGLLLILSIGFNMEPHDILIINMVLESNSFSMLSLSFLQTSCSSCSILDVREVYKEVIYRLEMYHLCSL